MKTVSADRSYIDYTREHFGVRVWKDRCQAIARFPDSEWQLRGAAKPLPLDGRFKDFPLESGVQPIPAITFEAGMIGSLQLDKLISGQLAFEDAIGSTKQ